MRDMISGTAAQLPAGAAPRMALHGASNMPTASKVNSRPLGSFPAAAQGR